MFNVMLDELPQEYEGYPISTSFRTGIMISMCLSDPELNRQEQLWTAIRLLFPDALPPVEIAMEALRWFLSENNHDNYSREEENSVNIMDYDVDQWCIYAAFMSQYHIDLATADMHWFVFKALLENLCECSMTDVMQLRQMKIPSNLSAKEKAALKKKKKIFALGGAKEEKRSERDEKALEEFLKYANVKV